MIHESILGGFNFLGDVLKSPIGQIGLKVAGQKFKIKELGWVPGGRLDRASVQPAGGPDSSFFPGGPVPTGSGFIDRASEFGGLGAPGAGGLAGAIGPGGVAPSSFGGRFVELAGKTMLDRWERAQAMPTQGVDVISLGQADDAEVAKLAIKHAVIPADSDLGQMLQMGGAKVTTRSVRMSDGTSVSMRVVEAKGARKRRRRNFNTVAGRRNAARTLRQMGQQVRTFKRLAKQGAAIDRALNPKRSSGGSCCPPKRASRSRCK